MLPPINQGLLIKPRNGNLDNIDLRVTLDKAVEDADLNVTERAALNQKFFPHGDGFKLFPLDKDTAQFTIYKRGEKENFKDKLSKYLKTIKCPDYINNKEVIFINSKKGNYKANLDSALNKLGAVLQDIK